MSSSSIVLILSWASVILLLSQPIEFFLFHPWEFSSMAFLFAVFLFLISFLLYFIGCLFNSFFYFIKYLHYFISEFTVREVMYTDFSHCTFRILVFLHSSLWVSAQFIHGLVVLATLPAVARAPHTLACPPWSWSSHACMPNVFNIISQHSLHTILFAKYAKISTPHKPQ